MRSSPRTERGLRTAALFLAVALSLAGGGRAGAADLKTWNIAGAGDWHASASWDPVGVPAAGDTVTVSTASAVIALTNSTAELAAFTMSAGRLVFRNWTTRLIATNVVLSGGTVTVTNDFGETGPSNRVWIVCANDFTLTAPGKIDVSYLGYTNRAGPGSPPLSIV